MARLLSFCAALGLGLAVAALAEPARAQSPSEIAAAKQWFTEGLALEDKGMFKEALERFQRALEVKKTPQIQFHVGLCQLKTGALVEAIVSLERASELAKAEGNKQVESAAAGELAALRPRVPVLDLSVKGAGKPRQVSLDGVALSGAALEAPIPVNPGKHELTAEFETGSVKKPFQVAEGERAKVEIEAPARAATEPVSPPVPPPAPPKPQPKAEPRPIPERPAEETSNLVPWILVGGGAVATLGGFYAWKLRNDKKDELDSLCPTETSCPSDRASDVDDLESKGKTYNTLAIALFSVGGVALGTGSFLLLSGGGSEKKTATRVAPALGPGMVAVRGRF